MQQQIESIQSEVDSMRALCELLGAAHDQPIRASSVHMLVAPIVRKLTLAAGELADQAERAEKRTV